MRKQAFLLTLIMISCSMLSGCLGGLGSNKEVVGIYEVATIGVATSANDDVLLEITLVSSSLAIEFTDGSALQQEENNFGLGFGKIISPNEKSNHGCIHEDYNPISDPGPEPDIESACLIVESVNDKIWRVGETITLSENINADGICNTQCDLILTILNGEGKGPDSMIQYVSLENDEFSATFSIN